MNIYAPKPQLGALDREPFAHRVVITGLHALKTHDGTTIKVMTAQYAGVGDNGMVKTEYNDGLSEAGNHNAIARAFFMSTTAGNSW